MPGSLFVKCLWHEQTLNEVVEALAPSIYCSVLFSSTSWYKCSQYPFHLSVTCTALVKFSPVADWLHCKCGWYFRVIDFTIWKGYLEFPLEFAASNSMPSSCCCLSTLSFLCTSAFSSWYRFLSLPFASLFSLIAAKISSHIHFFFFCDLTHPIFSLATSSRTVFLVPFQRSSGVTLSCATSNAVNLLVTSAANCTAFSFLNCLRFRGGMLCCLCLSASLTSWHDTHIKVLYPSLLAVSVVNNWHSFVWRLAIKLVYTDTCGNLWCAEEEEELRKALELSLHDIHKFESSACRNLNLDAAAAAAAAMDDDGHDGAAIKQFVSFTSADADSNAFGIIKDIRVNNIVASDTDKMSEFDSKNFKQLVNHADSAACVAVITNGASDAWTCRRSEPWSMLS